MVRNRRGAMPLAGVLLSGTLLSAALTAQRPSHLTLRTTRHSPTDLEIRGVEVSDAHTATGPMPEPTPRFITYAQLLTLPQETYTVTGDTNFGQTVRITGVALERLPALLGAAPGANMPVVICDDGYAAHYPPAYLHAHHPLLVLRVNGQPPAHWPVGVDGVPMGPYLVSHPDFQPAFHVLAHHDEAQVPWGVVRVDFRNEAQVYAAIAPFGPHTADLLVQQGYAIARQNCFRCHNPEGVGKSDRSWAVVARRAAADPQWFDAYVLNPKRINPASQMAASPGYDAATLQALHAYFNGFAERAP